MNQPHEPPPPVDTLTVDLHEGVRVLIERRHALLMNTRDLQDKVDRLQLSIAAGQASINQINETLRALGADLNQQPREEDIDF